MHFATDYIYHVYNRSNKIIFYNRDNYIFFVNKIRRYIFDYADILAWVLMPNHFHIMLVSNAKGAKEIEQTKLPGYQYLSKQIGTLLSSYTKAINKSLKLKGSLFAHDTNAKPLNEGSDNYTETCFKYIHQNPLKAKLVHKLSDWEFSSYPDYAGLRKGSLINKNLAFDILQIEEDNFINWSSEGFDKDDSKNIFYYHKCQALKKCLAFKLKIIPKHKPS
ncbi:MAG: hypothetical protein JXL97_13235 [Bacteroidales bacterium]|nr:hypothetical protein [Bacteroidales bacterium]